MIYFKKEVYYDLLDDNIFKGFLLPKLVACTVNKKFQLIRNGLKEWGNIAVDKCARGLCEKLETGESATNTITKLEGISKTNAITKLGGIT